MTYRMWVRRFDRLDLTLSTAVGGQQVEVDDQTLSEYTEVVERYQCLMRKLWVLHEEARIRASTVEL